MCLRKKIFFFLHIFIKFLLLEFNLIIEMYGECNKQASK